MPTGQRVAVVSRRQSGWLRGIPVGVRGTQGPCSRTRSTGLACAAGTCTRPRWPPSTSASRSGSAPRPWTRRSAATPSGGAVFVGLWPPMFWLIGDTLQDSERAVSPLEGPVPSAAMSVPPIAGIDPRQPGRSHRQHPDGEAHAAGARLRRRAAGQARGLQPGGLGQGPHRRGDDRGRRGRGPTEPGRNTIVESTSGNTGIALAFVAAAKGYELVVTLPQGMSREREKLLRLYGAQVVLVETMGGMNEAVEEARGASAASAATAGCRTSSPTRPTRTSTAAPPRRSARCGGRSTCSWRAWAPAAPSRPVAASASRSTTPTCTVAVEPKSSPVLSGGRPAAQDRRDRRRLRARGAQPRGDRRGAGGRRGRDRHGAPLRRPRGSAGRAVQGAALWAAIEVGPRPELFGKRVVAIMPDSGERYASTPSPSLLDHVRPRDIHRPRASCGRT